MCCIITGLCVPSHAWGDQRTMIENWVWPYTLLNEAESLWLFSCLFSIFQLLCSVVQDSYPMSFLSLPCISSQECWDPRGAPLHPALYLGPNSHCRACAASAFSWWAIFLALCIDFQLFICVCRCTCVCVLAHVCWCTCSCACGDRRRSPSVPLSCSQPHSLEGKRKN